MANEKVLHTRIQLKYDTLANWNASTFKLKAGELAIVKVGEMKDGSTHDNAQYPVLFKVGTGEHTFSQLPYASALAADVYAWAKASDVVLTGKTIQFKNGDTPVKSIELNYITETEAETLIANALKDYSTTEQMNAAIKVEADRAKAAEEKIATFGEDGKLNGGALFTEVNSLDGRVDTLEEHVGDSTKGLLKDVADLKTAVGEGGSVDSKIENAIAGLDAEKSQAAGTDGLALSITEVDGKITAISGSIAANTYDAHGAAAAAQSAAEKTASDALATARTEITAEIDADVKALADGAVKANADAIAEIKNGESGILATAKKYTDDEITELANGAVKTNTDDIAAINNADTGILAQAKAYTDDMKDKLLGEGIKDTFDTLVEIQNWIEGDGVNATELANAIAAEAKTRGEEDTKLQNQINALGITDGKVASAAEADHAATADNATSADSAKSLAESAKAEVKAVKVDNATRADSAAVADKASGLDDAGVAAVKAVKVDDATHADAATKVDNALTITTENGTAVVYDGSAVKSVDLTGLATKTYADDAEQAAKDYADSLAGNYATAAQGALAASAVQKVTVLGKELTNGGSVSVDEAKTALGLGTAAYKAEGDFATAAQGTKADSALQSIEAGTGLKVSVKENNKQTIDIDESVVFIFDCGSASKYID